MSVITFLQHIKIFKRSATNNIYFINLELFDELPNVIYLDQSSVANFCKISFNKNFFITILFILKHKKVTVYMKKIVNVTTKKKMYRFIIM